MGTFKVTEIVNPILDANDEKWIFIDGRDIHTLNDFFDQIEQNLTYKTNFKIGRNLNGFNDLLWGVLAFTNMRNLFILFGFMPRKADKH